MLDGHFGPTFRILDLICIHKGVLDGHFGPTLQNLKFAGGQCLPFGVAVVNLGVVAFHPKVRLLMLIGHSVPTYEKFTIKSQMKHSRPL